MIREEIEEDIRKMIDLLKTERHEGPYVVGFKGEWYDIGKGDKLPEELIDELERSFCD